MVHANKPGLPRTERALKSPLTAVLEIWLLSILHCRYSVISVAQSLFFFQVMLKRFREFPEMKMCRLAWRLMGSCGGVT